MVMMYVGNHSEYPFYDVGHPVYRTLIFYVDLSEDPA